MNIRISLSNNAELKPKIVVFGVGGAGGNAVNNMISANLEGVNFWVANTDAQALSTSLANNKIQLGIASTKGLGAGSHPEVGKAAAEESINDIMEALEDCHMLFIAAGMGGGTGTGAAPIIAKAAKELGILVVGVVTKPFHFEGARRMQLAELGLEEMGKYVDTLIVIPNQNLFRIANEKTTFLDAFKMADNVLHSGVRGVTDLITMPGLINLDFADIRAVMQEMGKAMMGTGEAEGEDRAMKAAEAAISNPLLDNSSMKGAKGVLINITGGIDMTLFEVDEAANRIKEEVETGANIIFGSAFNSDMEGKIRVSVVATGIDIKIHQTTNLNNNFPKNISETQGNIVMNLGTEEKKHITFSQKFDTLQQPLYQDIVQPTKKIEIDLPPKTVDSHEEANNNIVNKPTYFIPPKPIEPEEYSPASQQADISQDSNKNNLRSEAIKDQGAENTLSGLFGKMVSGFGHKADIEISPLSSKPEVIPNSPATSKNKEDFFEIPAFLRKKPNS